MESKFTILKEKSCRVNIVDTSNKVEVSTIKEIAHEDSTIINIIVNNTIGGDKIARYEIIDISNNPKESISLGYIKTELQPSDPDSFDYIAQESNEISSFQLPNDGKFTIYHIILPNQKWYNKFNSHDLFTNYSYVYYYDGKQIKKTRDGETIEDADLLEVATRNSVGTTIFKASKVDFSTCFLMNCFLNYCKIIFKQNKNKCIVKDDAIIFKRDFIWMTLNIIKYYLDFGQMEEAQRLLEEVMSCNGFCTPNILNFDLTNGNISGCNCGSKV